MPTRIGRLNPQRRAKAKAMADAVSRLSWADNTSGSDGEAYEVLSARGQAAAPTETACAMHDGTQGAQPLHVARDGYRQALRELERKVYQLASSQRLRRVFELWVLAARVSAVRKHTLAAAWTAWQRSRQPISAITHQATVEDLNQRMTDMRLTMCKMYEERLQDLQAKYEANIQDMHIVHEDRLARTQAMYEEKLANMLKDSDDKLAELRARYDDKLASLQDLFEKKVSAMRKGAETATAKPETIEQTNPVVAPVAFFRPRRRKYVSQWSTMDLRYHASVPLASSFS
eukprot:TRINITY_DN49510_c0_g1_i1.p1 TRINITY_DN49510_c0_g1~~TRINITY_DN49510_c0_g1_i1.p1  ORF type:complete len:288 (+),score=36.17 TRINITY_DN49510_c0_g1_i1:46-909(+)